MDERNLYHMFDQVKLSPERETAILNCLLDEERKAKSVNVLKELKRMKKLTAALVAAILLLMACAFTVATGLDQRLIEFLGYQTEDTGLLFPAAMEVDVTATAENGAELHISQVLSDCYSVMFLAEFTAPEGTVLDRDDYFFGSTESLPFQILDKNGNAAGEWESQGEFWDWLDDGDPGDNHATFIFAVGYAAWDIVPERVAFDLSDLKIRLRPITDEDDGLVETVVEGRWKFEVPLLGQDTGWSFQPTELLDLGGDAFEVVVSEIYISPMTLRVDLRNEAGDLLEAGLVYQEKSGGEWWWSSVSIQDGEGNPIPTELLMGGDGAWNGGVSFRFTEMIDPAQCKGGTVTICGQTFSLEGLTPAAA